MQCFRDLRAGLEGKTLALQPCFAQHAEKRRDGFIDGVRELSLLRVVCVSDGMISFSAINEAANSPTLAGHCARSEKNANSCGHEVKTGNTPARLRRFLLRAAEKQESDVRKIELTHTQLRPKNKSKKKEHGLFEKARAHFTDRGGGAHVHQPVMMRSFAAAA